MPDSLIFDGTDDKIGFTVGSPSVGSAAMTILFIVKFDTYTNYPQILTWNSLDGGLMLMSDNSIVAGDFGAGSDVSPFLLSGTSWQLIGYGKASGSATPRYHRYIWDTAAWSHGPGFNPISNFPAIFSGQFGDSLAIPGQNFDGNMLIGGIWNSNLSDGVVESLITGKLAWETAAPVVAWRFDTMSTISAFAGTSLESARTGTTLATGVAPAGWSDSAVAGGVVREAIYVGPDKTTLSTWTDSITPPGELSNTLMLVAVHTSETGDLVNSVTWNSVPLTELAKVGGSEFTGLQFWYLKGASGGFTANLVVSLTTAAVVGRIVCWYFSNVDQINPFRTVQIANGDAALSALTVPAVEVTDYLVDALTINSTGHAAIAIGGAQTEDYEDAVSTTCDTNGSRKDGENGGGMTWSWTTAAQFSHIAVGIMEPQPVASQKIRPDADVTTTGWTATPLFSKVDEAVTDDADFITSTAS